MWQKLKSRYYRYWDGKDDWVSVTAIYILLAIILVVGSFMLGYFGGYEDSISKREVVYKELTIDRCDIVNQRFTVFNLKTEPKNLLENTVYIYFGKDGKLLTANNEQIKRLSGSWDIFGGVLTLKIEDETYYGNISVDKRTLRYKFTCQGDDYYFGIW